jgi:hypothetical protein
MRKRDFLKIGLAPKAAYEGKVAELKAQLRVLQKELNDPNLIFASKESRAARG